MATDTVQGGKEREENVLETLVQNSPKVRAVAEDPLYEVQIIYTRIKRGEDNTPHFETFSYGDLDRYFYPASTVKLPVAAIALERLNRLEAEGVSRNTVLEILPIEKYPHLTGVTEDGTARGGKPSIGHYIRKAIIVSDNDAYNRLYEFIGNEHLNERLRELGHTGTRITHRFNLPRTPEQGRHTSAFRFFDEDGELLLEQPERIGGKDFNAESPLPLGKGQISGGKFIEEPLDFGIRNAFPLRDQQAFLKALIFPSSVPPEQRLALSEDDRRFLLGVMSELPRESEFPRYGPENFKDNYAKFFHPERGAEHLPHVRYFNKMGGAYGYLSDNAYCVDIEEGVEFFLSAAVFVNKNRVYNDGAYEYHDIGYPFLRDLGEAVWNYERSRKREREPDLSELRGLREARRPASSRAR